MTTGTELTEFISELRGSGVRLWLEGERLRYSARRGTMSPQLIARLSERKAEIVDILRIDGEADPWEARSLACEAAPPRLQRVPRDRELPLSFAQQRLWFLDQLAPGNSFYSVPLAIPLSVPPDVTVFQRSLDEIVRRHESLRTRFAMGKHGQPVQVIDASLRIPLAIHDLRDLPSEQRDAEVVRRLTDEALLPFDLATGPVIRFGLLRLGQDADLFMLTMHHIVSDAWSLALFGRELTAIYSAFATGRPSPLPELTIQYADFAVWQREYLTGRVLDVQLAYWKERLADLSTLRLPTDYARPAVQSHRGAFQAVVLSARTAAAVRSVARNSGTTPFMTLLAAFSVVLRRYTEQDDVVLGTAVAGRNRGELESLIGFFVNSLVLRIDASGDPTFAELLKRVRRTALGAFAHQDVPFEMLVEKLERGRDASRNPLFQVTFQLVNTPQTARAMEVVPTASQAVGSNRQGPEISRGSAIFDLAFTLVDEPDGFRGGIEYNTDLLESATIRRMIQHFQIVLEGATAEPGLRVSQLPMLSADECHQVLVEWNDTSTELSDQCATTLHELFSRQATCSPMAAAVVAPEGEVTFAELEHRAERLAWELIELGIGPGDIVAIAMHRSIETVVGMLGTLNAGAAYLPLDPVYPPQRLAFMLADSGARAVLTHTHLKGMLRADAVPIVCLDVGWGSSSRDAIGQTDPGGTRCSEEAGSSARRRPQESDPAYVIYTSGSTGTPKGVCVPHSAICNHMAWLLGNFQ